MNIKENLVVTHTDVWEQENTYGMITYDGQSEVLLDGFVPEIICGAICKHLDYDPDAVYYNDSVESNIKEVEV